MRLHLYFARRFTMTFLMVFGGFFAMMTMLDVIEQARRFSDEGAGLGAIVTLALLNVPQGIYRILPLIMILATIALFLALARSSELVVTRAAGRSAIRALSSPLVATFLIGCLAVAVLNPIVAGTSRAYEERAGAIEGDNAVLAVAEDGLWLRQGAGDSQTVIRAERTNLDGTILSGVTFLTFDAEGRPASRIEAESAMLERGQWRIAGAKIWPLADTPNPEVAARVEPAMALPSELTPDQIRDSFGTPSSIPIWELPQFIKRLNEAGFSARRHQVFLQMELAQPLLLVAMVMIGAAFTMRHQRGGRTGIMVLTAILLSFGIYFIRNFAQILGESGQIPPALAAWAPPVAAAGLALALLLHLEDG